MKTPQNVFSFTWQVCHCTVINFTFTLFQCERFSLRLSCLDCSLVDLDCFWQLKFLSCCSSSKQWENDLFIQEPVRTERRLASRCPRLDSLHTTWRWVWFRLPPPTPRQSSVACKAMHVASVSGGSEVLPTACHLSLSTHPWGSCCVAPQF